MMPKRIQRKRTKGWRMPENTKYVGRPSKWGNPYEMTEMTSRTEAIDFYNSRLTIMFMGMTKEQQRDWLAPLIDKDLACWCPIDKPCHADILLELAALDGGKE